MISSKDLLAQISTLGPKKQLAFALLVLERMFPYLNAFSRDTRFDNSCYLRAKDAAWNALRKRPVDEVLARACIRNAPDTEQFPHELTSYALNAALGIGEIAEFTFDNQLDHLAVLLTLVRDSVDLYLSSLDPSVLSPAEQNSTLDDHFVMKQELDKEENDIKFLSTLTDELDEEAISALRIRASNSIPLFPLALHQRRSG